MSPTIRTRIFAAIFVLATLLLLAGCKNDSSPTTTAPSSTIRVALLHPGRETDGGWNQLAYTALMQLHDRTGASVQHTYTPSRATFKSDLRDYARQGYTLVIAHGSEYVKAAREVAADFPNTRFVVTGSSDAGDGVATLDFRLWEATYLCGVLAAHLVPNGPAGLIGGQDFVTVRRTMDAFTNGARSVQPGYKSFAQYVGSWDDVAKAQQTAKSLIETRGVKVIFQNTDAAATGVFEAARAAKVIAFGCNSNQNAMAPNVVPASAIIDMEKAFETILADIHEKRFEPKAYVCDLKSGVIDVVLNPNFATRWPKDALPAFEKAKAKIIAGNLDVLKPAP